MTLYIYTYIYIFDTIYISHDTYLSISSIYWYLELVEYLQFSLAWQWDTVGLWACHLSILRPQDTPMGLSENRIQTQWIIIIFPIKVAMKWLFPIFEFPNFECLKRGHPWNPWRRILCLQQNDVAHPLLWDVRYPDHGVKGRWNRNGRWKSQKGQDMTWHGGRGVGQNWKHQS